jgi:transposase
MYIESIPNHGSNPTVLLRESHREKGRVVKRTIANLTNVPDDIVALIKLVLKGEPLVPVNGLLTIDQSLPHGHVHAVLETIRALELDTIIASKPSRSRDLVLAMIVNQLISPSSKLGLTRQWHQSTLAQELHVDDSTEDDLYDALDWLVRRQDRIVAKLAKRHLSDNTVVLYDMSNSTYYGTRCSLATFAMNKDGSKKPCIAWGLLTDRGGCPIAVSVYPGRTSDTKTIPDQVDKLRTRFDLRRVVLVGDRGMITNTRIEEFRAHEAIGWISALRTEAIRNLVDSGTLQLSLFDEQNLAEISSEAFPGERLVACYNPFLAADRARTRTELLEASERAFDGISAEVRRRTRTPMTEQQISLKVGAVRNSKKVGKHFHFTIADNHFSYERNEASITEESRLDGVYVIRTSEAEQMFPADDVVRTYKSLADVETAFRCMKSVDMCIRPIRHSTEEHVRAHVFLNMLAYYVQWQMRRALAPVLCSPRSILTMNGRIAIPSCEPCRPRRYGGKRTTGQPTTDGRFTPGRP